MTEAGTEWAAGIIDGEGCVLIEQLHGYYYKIQVNVGNSDPRIVEPFYRRWGGHLSPYTPRKGSITYKTSYVVSFSAQEASVMLSDTIEYLRAKKAAARLVLEAIKARDESHIGNRALEPYYWGGVRKGLWGTKKPSYNSTPEAEKELSAKRLRWIARIHPTNRHLRVLDKKTGITYKTRRQCGEALAYEHRLPIGIQAWDKIYARDPNRFSLYPISI